jgi:hypothetical protein
MWYVAACASANSETLADDVWVEFVEAGSREEAAERIERKFLFEDTAIVSLKLVPAGVQGSDEDE